MKIVRTVGRPLLAGCLGAVTITVAFGLLLGLAWMPLTRRDPTYMLITTLLVTAIAFLLGGYVAGRIVRRHTTRAGMALGCILGLIAFGYILGAHWSLLIAVPLATLAGAAGGRLARRPAPAG